MQNTNNDTNNDTETYAAELFLWSSVGHTPITKRGGSYCDELARVEVEVTGPKDARAKLAELAARTRHAYKGFYFIPELPNQNLRSLWVCGSDLLAA